MQIATIDYVCRVTADRNIDQVFRKIQESDTLQLRRTGSAEDPEAVACLFSKFIRDIR
jgi:hypothetical protein